MNLSHVNIVGKYESKVFCRSWIFRIFVVLALLGVAIMLSGYFSSYKDDEHWLRTALSSHVPYMGAYLYSIVQTIIVIFLSGDFLHRDKKFDAVQVVHIRPMTNTEYLVGKVYGVVRIFFLLNVVALLCVALLHLTVLKSPFSLYPYLFYLFVLGLPSLLFMLGLSYMVICLVKNQAIAFVILLGLAGMMFYYGGHVGHGVLDLFCSVIPTTLSDITGHVNLPLFLLQRLTFCLAGIGFLCFTTVLLQRLPNLQKRVIYSYVAGAVFMSAAIVSGGLYYVHFSCKSDLRKEYVVLFDKYATYPYVHISEHALSVTPQQERLEGVSRLALENEHPAAIQKIILYLNPGLEILEVTQDGRPLKFERERQVVQIDKSLESGETAEVTIRYAGTIDEAVCYLDVPDKDYWDWSGVNKYLHPGKRYVWLEETFTLLTPECMWYPVAAAPVCPSSPYNLRRDFTDYQLTVCHDSGKTVLSQGESRKEGDKIIFTNPTPLPCISLTIADYERKAIAVDSVSYEMLYFPGHDTFSSNFLILKDSMESFIREQKWKIERDMNACYPFTKFVLAETPAQFHAYVRNWKGTSEQVMPEIVFIQERGYVQNTDFGEEMAFRKKNMPKELINPELIERNALSSYIFQKLALPAVNVQKSSPLFIHPMFKQYVRCMYSAEYPILDVIFAKMAEPKPAAISVRADPCVNDKQRANAYLGSHNLAEAIMDADLKPGVLNELLNLKARELESYIGLSIPLNQFRSFLNDFLERHRFRSVSFAAFEEAFKEEFNKADFKDYFEEWYHKDRIPTLVFRDGETFKISDEKDERYQTRLKVYNPSDVDAMIPVEVRAFDYRTRSSEEYGESYMIPAGEARELRLITYMGAAAVTISTMSHNIPSDYRFYQGRDYKTTRDTSHGAFPIDPQIFKPDPNVIIIDNENPGFRAVDYGKNHRLKEVFSKEREDKYQPFLNMVGRGPERWTPTAGMTAYGESIQSCVCKKSGEGRSYAEWKTTVPKEGYYEVSVWNASMGLGGGKTVVAGQIVKISGVDQTYTVSYGEEKETFTIDFAKEEQGWVILETFHLMEEEEFTVTLTDKSENSLVVADAIRLKKVK